MLAPYVTNLLIACSLLLVAGGVNPVLVAWSRQVRHRESSASRRATYRTRPSHVEIFGVCDTCNDRGNALVGVGRHDLN
jgi:hypothetical protein